MSMSDIRISCQIESLLISNAQLLVMFQVQQNQAEIVVSLGGDHISGDKAGSTYVKLANCHLKVTQFTFLWSYLYSLFLSLS